MAGIPAGYVKAHPGLTSGEYHLVAARLRRELPAVRSHGEPIAGAATAPGAPAFALWVHPDDAGERVASLVMETISR